jgi:flagellar biosynthetic protein FliO
LSSRTGQGGKMWWLAVAGLVTAAGAQPAPTPVPAESAVVETAVAAVPLPGESIGTYVIRMVLSLLVVVVLIYAAVYVFRRLSGPRAAGGGIQRSIRVLGHYYLGPRKALYLVEIVNRILVLGITGTSIQLVTEIKDPETIEVLRRELSAEGFHYPFSQYLNRFLGKTKGRSD